MSSEESRHLKGYIIEKEKCLVRNPSAACQPIIIEHSLFEAWTKQGHNVKYRESESLDREVFPDDGPVPIIRYDSEKSRAEILYSDGSKTIDHIVDVLNRRAEEKYLEVVNE